MPVGGSVVMSAGRQAAAAGAGVAGMSAAGAVAARPAGRGALGGAGGQASTPSGVVGSSGSGGASSGGSPAIGGAGASASGAAAGQIANAGASAAGGAGQSATMAAPSAGCSKDSTRPAEGVVMGSDRIYSFPSSYDGNTPMPLLLALHAAGNPNTQLQRLTNGSELEQQFVRAFPKSAGSAWSYETDVSKLNAVVGDVLENYCIDTNRIFGTGHSSGAQMIVQMLCKGDMRFRAVAPVAASKYCANVNPTPVMYIHGMEDAQRGGGNGSDVVQVFATSNGCGSDTTPKSDVVTCSSTFDKQLVQPGCVTYRGCSEPTIWCSHDDSSYNSTDGRQHGWPCFASRAIADFFLALR